MKKRCKRSRRIRLVLLSGLSAGALAGCSPSDKAPVSADNVYANNDYIPGVGYYHAPFRAWYPLPYNQYDPARRMYYWGGGWRPVAMLSITNLSSPTAPEAARAEAMRGDITRGGFGSTGGSHFYGGS